MGQKLSKAKRSEGTYLFRCPGCKSLHVIYTDGAPPQYPHWAFNGSLEAPTFSPSLLVRWNELSGEKVCHSFITDGNIQFLNDCTHPLAGKTVPLPDYE